MPVTSGHDKRYKLVLIKSSRVVLCGSLLSFFWVQGMLPNATCQTSATAGGVIRDSLLSLRNRKALKI